MMSRDKQLPLQSLHPLRWDLGFPYDYDKTLVEKNQDKFRIFKNSNGLTCIKLEKLIDEFAVSELQKSNEIKESSINNGGDSYRRFTRGQTALAFPLSFPRGYGAQKKCKTTSVALKEGYRRGKLVNPSEIAKFRGKFHHVMRTGLIYRKKGLEMLPELDKLVEDDSIGINGEESCDDEEVESSGEWVDHEDGDSEFDDGSDQD
ncbi:hypothetical protein L1987_81766 [Smallanthus sonchifolius]|uniref:Uncharacterized protein n=1 Tax=Smallanthus sonchifolius TaxID=185202 RepID=A0ACB8YVM5_9ASTR|nr:hypothetical protein L1987_81766 [Smallanthus sonchifolius]